MFENWEQSQPMSPQLHNDNSDAQTQIFVSITWLLNCCGINIQWHDPKNSLSHNLSYSLIKVAQEIPTKLQPTHDHFPK